MFQKEIYDKLWYKITKSAAVDCKQAVNDDQRAGFFFQHLHQLFGNIDAITYFKTSDFTNRQILTLTCGYRKETFLQCDNFANASHVVAAAFLDHDEVQKTDLKPLQLVKSE